jgi:signal transduction histidine kinase
VNIIYEFLGVEKSHVHFLFVSQASAIAILMFAREFLELKNILPRWGKFFTYLIVFSAIKLLSLPFTFDVKIVNLLHDVTYLIDIVSIITASFLAYFAKRQAYSLWFSLSWASFGVGMTGVILAQHIAEHNLTHNILFMVSGMLGAFYFVSLGVLYKSNSEKSLYFQRIENHNELLKKEIEVEKMKIKENEASFASEARYLALGRLAGSLAHEFNNPLAIISGSNSLVKRFALRVIGGETLSKKEVDSFKKAINSMDAASSRMAGTLRSLLSYADSEESEEIQEIDLDRVLSDVFSINKREIEMLGIDIRLEGIKVKAFNTNASQNDIFQVLACLVTNACEYLSGEFEMVTAKQLSGADVSVSPAVRWLDVKSKVNGSYLEIEISNSGEVIPDEISEKMWEPFFSRKTLKINQGLGLFSARGLTESFGGSISYSKVTGHSVFTVKIPTNG